MAAYFGNLTNYIRLQLKLKLAITQPIVAYFNLVLVQSSYIFQAIIY